MLQRLHKYPTLIVDGHSFMSLSELEERAVEEFTRGSRHQ